jgi:hypothetical protein
VSFPTCDDPSFTGPIWTSNHLTPPYACAMIGGEVYRGCALPELRGRYFFTDYCTSLIRSFLYDPVGGVQDLRDHTPELGKFYPLSQFITSFGTDGGGELLFVYQATPDLDGKVYRMIAAQTPAGFVDCDANGKDDGCEIAADASLDLDADGVKDDCQWLSSGAETFSVSAGGFLRLRLRAGAAHAGRLYLLAGSVTGTSGISLGGVTVPLTFDSYTNFTIVHPDSIPLLNNLNVLDPAGNGLALFTTPPGLVSTSMIGVRVYHAFALIAAGGIDRASNAVALRFGP